MQRPTARQLLVLASCPRLGRTGTASMRDGYAGTIVQKDSLIHAGWIVTAV
jgi:hypothetical protein